LEHISTIYHNYHDDVPFSVALCIAHVIAHFSAGHGDFFGWSCFLHQAAEKVMQQMKEKKLEVSQLWI
jgi:hypothetical protein